MTTNSMCGDLGAQTRYNYERFRPHHFDLATFDGPGIGQRLPDVGLTTVDGHPVRLSDFAGRTVVIETGSVTCPMYAKGIDGMNRLAAQHPDVVFAVLYVREAHPGERIGRHCGLDEKRAAARLTRSALDERRLILVDDLEGTLHLALGGLPNMVYVIGPDGLVRFRGDWTQVDVMASVLAGTADPRTLGREHFPPAKPRPATAIRTLLNGGRLALFDFVIGLPGLLIQHRRADRRQGVPGGG